MERIRALFHKEPKVYQREDDLWVKRCNTKLEFYNELYSLRQLERRYECTCGRYHSHFPRVIEHNIKKKTLVLSDCGPTVASQHHNACIASLQIGCIINNLRRNGIVHNDIHRNNLCVADDGTLALIDFSNVTIDHDYDHFETQRQLKMMVLLDKFN